MIIFESVSKSFGNREVLKEISFSLPKGGITFLIGASGTGKSVCLKHMVGLIKPDTGKVVIGDMDVTQLDEENLSLVRRRCGMVFQQPALFDSLTVFDNVAYGARRHLGLKGDELKLHVRESLDLVNLGAIEDRFPSEISYGMQKRVSLARTVAGKPNILLFDEPTTGLDPQTTRSINHLIQDLSKSLQTTSVVVSHDMDCAMEIADRVLVLDGGRIAEDAPPEKLIKSSVPIVQDFLREIL